jgi:hypothetical protein
MQMLETWHCTFFHNLLFHTRFMKRITTIGTVLAAVLALAACDPQKKQPRKMPAPTNTSTKPKTEKIDGPNTPTINPDSADNEMTKPRDSVTNPIPEKKNNIPDPTPTKAPDYAIKVEGKPGYVKSPYDSQGRLIDVRGLPPGTEAECPYTQRTFLVPP